MAVEIKSIQTKKIYKNIVEQIITLISEGSLKCGDKLPPERTLAEMLHVSRASLREALSVMEIMGIVDIRAGEGSFVSDLDVQPFISLMLPLLLKANGIESDLLQIRMLLEVSGVKIVIDNLKEEEPVLEELRNIINKMETEIDNAEEGIRLDMQFHKVIYSRSNNSILMKVLQYVDFILMRTIKFSRNRLMLNKENANLLLEQHRRIFRAIEERNAEMASKEMEQHLKFIYDAVWK